jgi:L-alanine-DL-glutamate epimerase-like enolase superfamily enzyme
MRITAIETLRLEDFPNLLYVRLHTDEGLTGLGETFFGARAVEAYLHESAAPVLLGKDPLRIDQHAQALYGYVGYGSTGAEMRGASAVDIALWDLLGQVTGQPLYQLLGGRVRDTVRTYNTCAGYTYVRARPVQAVDNWGLPASPAVSPGPYEDLDAFLHRPDELARSLLDEGFTGMKIWPFDPFAEASGGHFISNADLRTALEPFRKIRKAVGDRIDIMVEFHSLWDLPTARRICQALEEFEPFWFEDPLKADNLEALAELAAHTRVPLTLSETIAGRWRFKELMDRHAVGVVMLDVSWVGGISEARQVAALAGVYKLPVAPHDCTGPVTLVASTHLSVHAPNALVQEMVRAFCATWYRDLVTELPEIGRGWIAPPEGPGLGTALQPDIERRPDARVTWSRLDA